MVTVVDELFAALDSDPALLEAARARLLTRDLLEMPERMARMSATLERLMLSHDRLATSHERLAASHERLLTSHEELKSTLREFVDATNARFDRVDERFDRVDERFDKQDARFDRVDARFDKQDARFDAQDARFDRVDARFDKQDARFDRMDERFDRVDARQDKQDARQDKQDIRQDKQDARQDRMEERLDRMTRDVGDIKGWQIKHQFDLAIEYHVFNLGYELIEVVPQIARAKMMKEHGDALGIPRGDRMSFSDADAVAKVQDEDGRELYLAIEVSFTVHWQDTNRAIRNAEFLRRITGLPAHPVVAGAQVNERIQPMIDSGEALFVKIRVKQAE